MLARPRRIMSVASLLDTSQDRLSIAALDSHRDAASEEVEEVLPRQSTPLRIVQLGQLAGKFDALFAPPTERVDGKSGQRGTPILGQLSIFLLLLVLGSLEFAAL